MTRRERASHDFSNIIFPNRREAESVADKLYEYLGEYGEVTVTDLYGFIGITPDFPDSGFGWTNLTGTRVRQTPRGFVLELPRTMELTD